MLNPTTQVATLRRMDILGTAFVVMGAFSVGGKSFLPLAAEAEFDAALASLQAGQSTPPRVVWVEEQGEVLLPVSDEQIRALNRLALDQLKTLLEEAP